MSEPTANDGPVPISFPQYNGIQVADRRTTGILTKVMNRMLRPKAKSRSGRPGRPGRKGIHSNQNVKIGKKKPHFF
jgi:hypothetical protein